MPFDHEKLMGALLASAAMAMLLNPLAASYSHPRLERAVVSLTSPQFWGYTPCAQSEGVECGLGLGP